MNPFLKPEDPAPKPEAAKLKLRPVAPPAAPTATGATAPSLRPASPPAPTAAAPSLGTSASATPGSPLAEGAEALHLAEQNQRLGLGIVSGAAAMLVGTAVWVGVTVGTHYQIGYLAIGVGALVGLAVRFGGRAVSPIFSVVGAVLGLLGCVLGNLFSGCYFFAAETDRAFLDVVAGLNPELAFGLLGALFSPVDLIFYAGAAWAGWKFSRAG